MIACAFRAGYAFHIDEVGIGMKREKAPPN
jgi:hypothetical protein